MKKLLSACLTLALLVSPVTASEWKTPKQAVATKAVAEKFDYVVWEGSTDADMLKQVRIDLERARVNEQTLSVTLISPGGPVITSLEIARLIWVAQQRGQVIEIRGAGIVASGGTFVLAAATPGRRYISKWAFFLVHPPQKGGFFSEPSCLAVVPEPKTVDEKAVNTLLILMRDMYIEFTKKPQEEVEKWLTCGNEIVGTGALAISMGIADEVRE